MPQKLINGLTDLGMEKMQEFLPHYSELVNKGDISFSEALEELVEIEKKNKQTRRDAINLHIANFPFIKTLDDFDFDFQPNLNKKELLELNGLGFVESRENIILVGTSGVGKTHLATSLGISCVKARYQTYFITLLSSDLSYPPRVQRRLERSTSSDTPKYWKGQSSF